MQKIKETISGHLKFQVRFKENIQIRHLNGAGKPFFQLPDHQSIRGLV
jgi:ABC-type molybdenum transport system ATPase subunit/photorepair protein PhrA